MLNLQGNKSRLADKIISHFPPHDLYIEPFFGAGGLFFNKRKARYNILNDIEYDVFNLYEQVTHNKQELIKLINITPITEHQFSMWESGKREKSKVLNAVRFLFLQNFTLYASGSTLKYNRQNTKENILKKIDAVFYLLSNVIFANSDFEVFLNRISKRDIQKAFIYCDPPYLYTKSYKNNFTEKDSIRLFNALLSTRAKYAISEFPSKFILGQAKKRKLNVYNIGERHNLKNIRQEIIITNYTVPKVKPLNIK